MPPRSMLSGDSPSRLGGILSVRRRELGVSLREMARRAGVSPSYLLALERGRNPSTGRAPVPSPAVLAAIARGLDIDMGVLLDAVGVAPVTSTHLLLFQTGAERHPPIEAAKSLFAGRVDAWIEIGDPRYPGDGSGRDVLVRTRRPLISPPLFQAASALAALSDVLAESPPVSPASRLGIVFAANSAVLRSIENPPALLASETTWERDVATEFRAGLGIEPAANICVYCETDIQEIASRLDPLATVVRLVQTHPHVAVQDADGALTSGPAAIELILAAARPAGASTETWRSLTRAAAVGFAREATFLHPPGA